MGGSGWEVRLLTIDVHFPRLNSQAHVQSWLQLSHETDQIARSQVFPDFLLLGQIETLQADGKTYVSITKEAGHLGRTLYSHITEWGSSK